MISSVRSQVQQLDSNLALTNVQTIGELLSQGLWRRAWARPARRVRWTGAGPRDYRGLWSLVVFGESANPRIGNSMAMGAQPGRVLQLVVGQGMRLAGAACFSACSSRSLRCASSKAYSSASALTTR